MWNITMQILSYPKIYNLGHPAIKQLFDDNVEITTKVDGSAIYFCRCEDELIVHSKNRRIYIDACDGMFQVAVEQLQRISPLLHPGWIYRGEYLQKPKHNVLCYNRVPKNNIIIYNIETSNQTFLPYYLMVQECERIGLETVELLDCCRITSQDQLQQYLNHEDMLGGTKIEGVVCKNYNKFGRDGKVLMGKLVRPEFRERSQREWKKSNPTLGTIIDQLGQSYRTEARWRKAIQHLSEQNQIEHSPRDIGKVIKEIQRDFVEECSDEVAAAILQYALPHLQRNIVAGFAEWNKESLIQSQFNRGNKE